MKFVHPEFLWALSAIAIPIIIHLFNFRKYKTLYFSSLTFIKKVDQQTRSTKKLKHLLVLFLRILAITAAVLAFAQPYFPVDKSSSPSGKPVLAIYIDNSFSMTSKGTDGELISEAREFARKMINQTSADTRILLSTNMMNGIEQRLISKIEALDQLDKIEPISITRRLDDVINWQKGVIDQENETKQKIGTRQFVFFSDFQKSTARFNQLNKDSLSYFYPVLLKPQKRENIYIDSIWFSSPIRKVGQNNELNIRIANSGDAEALNLQLRAEINGIRRDAFVDIPGLGKQTTQINYSEVKPGYKKGKITINDRQLFWDDDFYFSYFVDDKTDVLILNGEQSVDAVEKVYRLEKYYQTDVKEYNAFTLDQLKGKDLVILNGINSIPSGTKAILEDFARTGGTIALFPGTKINFGDWNAMLTSFDMPGLGPLRNNGTKIEKLMYEDPFFSGMFEKKPGNLNIPALKTVYSVTGGQKSQYLDLIRLQNGQGLFMHSSGQLNVFLFSSSLHPDFGSFTSDAIFPSILLRVGELSQRKAPLTVTIGSDNNFPVYSKRNNDQAVHLVNDPIDFIPSLKTVGLINYISLSGQEALETLTAGTYKMTDPSFLGYLSMNYDRIESDISAYDKTTIEDSLSLNGIKNVTMSEVADTHSLTKIDLEKPKEFWKLFILLSLIFLLLELIVLKFWK